MAFPVHSNPIPAVNMLISQSCFKNMNSDGCYNLMKRDAFVNSLVLLFISFACRFHSFDFRTISKHARVDQLIVIIHDLSDSSFSRLLTFSSNSSLLCCLIASVLQCFIASLRRCVQSSKTALSSAASLW
jgi:hypothetical protein